MEIESHLLVARDGVRIAYHELGNLNGPVLVLSNGLGGNIHAWKYLLEYFHEDYRIIS